MNDVYGHKAGDALIKSAADKLRFWNRFGDVYRMGGDEFFISVGLPPYYGLLLLYLNPL